MEQSSTMKRNIGIDMGALTHWNHSKQREMKRKVLSSGSHCSQQMLSLHVIMVEDSCPEML